MEPEAPLAYAFDADLHLDPEELLSLLGGKGCGLAVMTGMGLPVPPGFTLTTDACRRYLEHGWTDEHDLAVRAGLAELEVRTGRRLGDPEEPLLVSVRSGSEVSMPGMLDSVLDVGMTDEVAQGLTRRSGGPAFAGDTARRALLSYATVVFGLPAEVARAARQAPDVDALRRLLDDHGLVVPPDPVRQVTDAVASVFDSWGSPRAEHYRAVEGIDDRLGTAATVQAMVFGNLDGQSGTGVAFSRHPSTGERRLVGDFLRGAQGEDVVAGGQPTASLDAMRHQWPQLWDQLADIAARLERAFTDMVDIEFTVERGQLFVLQVRPGKRSPAAAVRVAVEMAEDPDFPLERAEAVVRCRHLLDAAGGEPAEAAPDGDGAVLATGLAASPGRIAGVLCLDVDDAVALGDRGVPVILAREETSPTDVHGIAAAAGLVTTLGGLVSHAAVVARSWGLPAVVGASGLEIVGDALIGNGIRVAAGEIVTVDGDEGRVLLGDHGRSVTRAPEADVLRAWAAELDAG